MYQIIDSHTSKIVATLATLRLASRKVERLNQSYGAVRYYYQAI